MHRVSNAFRDGLYFTAAAAAAAEAAPGPVSGVFTR